jgi:hypothetical protein
MLKRAPPEGSIEKPGARRSSVPTVRGWSEMGASSRRAVMRSRAICWASTPVLVFLLAASFGLLPALVAIVVQAAIDVRIFVRLR